MSVNTMSIEDVYQLLNTLHNDIYDQQNTLPFTAVDTSTFVSLAQRTFQAGTDIVYNTLMNTIAKTVFSTRPYTRQFKGLIVDDLQWGGIVRKVSFGDTFASADSAFHNIIDGQSVDHYIVNKGEVVETHYYGSDVYQDWYTVFESQLRDAFSGPEQLGSFVAAKTNEINNKWVQWNESLARTLLTNAIAAKYHDTTYTGHTKHLITEYNALTGLSLDIQTIWLPANVKSFWEFVKSRILTISREMSIRSNAYQFEIYDTANSRYYTILRHTPAENQKIYLTADFMDIMETSVLSEVFNDDYLKYADIEKVATWQGNPAADQFAGAEVDISKYVTLNDSTGGYKDVTVPSGSETIAPVLGIIFDEDAARINIKETKIVNTPLNGRGLYFNSWLTARAQYALDLSEKVCLLMLD